MDSFFEDPKPKCCDPFPGSNLKFCWEVDSNYCTTCGRWLEHPDVIKRLERHDKTCPNEQCVLSPKFCMCSHSDAEHHKSLKLNFLRNKSDDEMLESFRRLMHGPHNCGECDCTDWKPNYEGPCD